VQGGHAASARALVAPSLPGSIGSDSGARTQRHHTMDWGLLETIGTKLLWVGQRPASSTDVQAVKAGAQRPRINPLLKQFFTQVASGQIDGAYLLTTKNYRSHVKPARQFIRLPGRAATQQVPQTFKSGRPRLQGQSIILHGQAEVRKPKKKLALDFHLVEVEKGPGGSERIRPAGSGPSRRTSASLPRRLAAQSSPSTGRESFAPAAATRRPRVLRCSMLRNFEDAVYDRLLSGAAGD